MVGIYFEQLHYRPVLTKSLTAAVLSVAANFISQRLDSSQQEIDSNALVAYGLVGLLFGGTVPHYFYGFIEKLTQDWRKRKYWQFFLQRLLFTPGYTAISLYFLSFFEYASPQIAMKNLMMMYKKVLIANWKYLSLPIFINFKYVHPMVS